MSKEQEDVASLLLKAISGASSFQDRVLAAQAYAVFIDAMTRQEQVKYQHQ